MSYPIIGLLRIRNESLILTDTLNHLSQFVDGIIVFDDASTDRSVKICQKHKKVLQIINNPKWRRNREEEETRHRQVLLEAARKYQPQWLFFADADERFEGEIRSFLLSKESEKINGIRIRLLDAYLTLKDQKPYKKDSLLNFRQFFGPEMRQILMIFRNQSRVKFQGLDAREPYLTGKVITKFWCQHYGKAISKKHWQETCQYYINHFPKYAQKWQKRLNKSIHAVSDFGRPLFSWSEVKKNPLLIYQYQPFPKSFPSAFLKFFPPFFHLATQSRHRKQ